MHSVRTYILRFFIDPDAPGEVKGSIQSILEPTPIPFNNLEHLSSLVEQLARAPQERRLQPKTIFDGEEL
jgi:hypothetical protein